MRQILGGPETQKKRYYLVLCLLIACFLTSCSTLSLTYNYADWLLYWKIDQYFELSSHQKPLLHTHLTQLHSWHRKEEIPRYVSFLQTIHRHWQNGLTQQELNEIFDHYEILRRRLGSRVAIESVEFLTTVKPAQIQHLEAIMQKENQELLTEIGKDPETRRLKRIERVLDWLTSWLGEIPSSQKYEIVEVINQYPDTTDQWLKYRTYRQHRFATLLRSGGTPQTLKTQIHEWLVAPEKNAPRALVLASKKRKQHLKHAILAIDDIITRDQRQFGSARLFELIEEVHQMGKS